jgi:putative ABC transport system permease protein
MPNYTLLQDNFKISFQSITANKLRAILTVFIIAFGIMALVGILTAIDSIKYSLNEQFTVMGANSFSISSEELFTSRGGENEDYPEITFRQALKFKEEYQFPAKVSIRIPASNTATVKYKSVKSNPNIQVVGTDNNYLLTSGYNLKRGRNFSVNEIHSNVHLVIIGSNLSAKLFNSEVNPLGEVINIGSGKYKIIGVLEEKGSGFGGGSDRICILPITNVRQYFTQSNMDYTITILPNEPRMLKMAISEAIGVFRIIRGLRPGQENNFATESSDSLTKLLLDNLKYVTIAATIIGIITLFGAAVGLMNIMLVSVTERTREIGIRKAIGAKSKTIRQQFLFESVLIGQFGGVVGIVFGIIIGNFVSLIVGSSFVVPWLWIISGLLVCFAVGLISGLIPATKAARVDPIVSLRYE